MKPQVTAAVPVSSSTKPVSMIATLYERHEHLAEKYAKKIYNAERISYDYEDVLQEMKMKVYTSIIAYAEKWRKWQQTQRYKPIAIEIYLQCALVNKTKDFIKSISQCPIKCCISVQDNNFDFSIFGTMESQISFTKDTCECKINEVDLLEGLNLMESRCFMLYLRGYKIDLLNKMFKRHFSADEIIGTQLLMLRDKKEQLTENKITTYMSFTNVESE